MNPESLSDNDQQRVDRLRKPKSVELKMLSSSAKIEQARCGSGVCAVDWKPSADRDDTKKASNN